MKFNKNYIILLILISVFFIIVYPSTQVSKPQFSSFYGNIDDFNLRGNNCLVEFNAESISFVSKSFRINSVRNITIESNGEKRLINYSSYLYVKNHENYSTYLPVGNVHVDIFLGNSTISKHSNTIELTGDMSNTYMNNFKLKNGTREVAIANYGDLDYLSVEGEEVTDFEVIYFELDDNSKISFNSNNISLIANTISDFEILRSTKSQMLEMTLYLGEGTLLLDDHLFEIKGSNILNIELLPQTQGKNFYIDNTKARFYGLTNFVGLNTEDIVISDFEYWIKIEPEKLNAYAVVILVILTGSYAWSTRSILGDQRKINKVAEIKNELENAYCPLDEAANTFKLGRTESDFVDLLKSKPSSIIQLYTEFERKLLDVRTQYGYITFLDNGLQKCDNEVSKSFKKFAGNQTKENLSELINSIDRFQDHIQTKIREYNKEIKTEFIGFN